MVPAVAMWPANATAIGGSEPFQKPCRAFSFKALSVCLAFSFD